MIETNADEEALRRNVREEIEAAFPHDRASKRAAIIASKGTLDGAYPPLVLATAAAAAGMETSVFFTFHGLDIVHREFESKLGTSPSPIPDIVAALPGMAAFAAGMTTSMLKRKDAATIRDLLVLARGSGVRLIACRMTMNVFGYRDEELIDEVELGDPAAFLAAARQAHLTLFV
jgi:peroxiredoxin family protein